MDFFDEAVKYREIARVLHEALGRTPCACVETPEYKEYLAKQVKDGEGMEPAERLLRWILDADPFVGEKLAQECNRCVAMYKYEVAIGDEAVDMEVVNRLQAGGSLFPNNER